MPSEVTVDQLVELHAATVGLRWLACREAGARSLKLPDGIDEPGRSVGHMNLVRPGVVQIIGDVEAEYLDGLDPQARSATIARLFDAGPACVIVAGGRAADPMLREAAERSGTPLLGADADSDRVVRDVQHFIARRLARRDSRHGVFLDVMGLGVLLTGEAGIGKSELALELLSRGHRLIADDAPEFCLTAPDTLEGTCPESLRDYMEVRGLGIINVRHQFGDGAVRMRRNLRLIIRLATLDPEALGPDERLDGIRHEREILGVSVPEVTLPVAPGRNLAVLVECSVRNHLLRAKGFDASQEFAERHNRLMQDDGDR